MERSSYGIAIAMLVACWGSPPPSPAPSPALDRNGPTLEQARTFERGTGVSRDYRRAAAIYDRLCADGRGSLEACHELADAIRDAPASARSRHARSRTVVRACSSRTCAAAMARRRSATGERRDIPELTAAAVSFEISYQRVRFGSAAPAVDATRCPAQRPQGSQQIYGW